MKLKDLLKETERKLIGYSGRKNMDALIKADKTGKWIFEAGYDWKKFDFDRGLDALLKIAKVKLGCWVYKAGMHWEKFDYNKALKVLKQIGGECYEDALDYWPKGLKQSIAKTKELERISKKLPMKKLKLENIKETKSAKQICQDGRDGKKYDLNALIKADEDGFYIYDAGRSWKKFDYEKGFDALIKKDDDDGEWIYNAGISWEKFNYKKGFNALKQINPYYYEQALKKWPKGIKQNIAKTKELEKTSKKLPMKRLKLK